MPIASPIFRSPSPEATSESTWMHIERARMDSGSTRMDTIEKTFAREALSRSWTEGSVLRHTPKWTLSYQHVRQQQAKRRRPESVEAKYEKYRAWYLSRSPEDELQYLNTAILRVQRWLRKKQQDLKAGAESVQNTLAEAKDQQAVLDLIVTRSRQYLHRHPNIVLEVDLENLVYLWRAYCDKLNKLSLNSLHQQVALQGASRCSPVSEVGEIEAKLFRDKYLARQKSNDEDVLFNPDGPQSEELTPVGLSERFLKGQGYGSRSEVVRVTELWRRGHQGRSPSQGKVREHGHNEIVLRDFHHQEQRSKSPRSSNQNHIMDPVKEVELAKGGVFEIHVVTPEKNGMDSYMDGFGDLDLPTEPKRRKMNDTPSSLSSRSVSPSAYEWWDESRSSTPGGSPAPRSLVEFKRKYRKDELWKAIESHYQYIMDKEIIETCKSTESDLSLDDEDFAGNPNVSFAEFLQQYRELTEWLNQIHRVTKRSFMCLSEKYLNQTYHEEMLERSPRRKFFNEYAKQLLLRYPHMKDEISTRMSFLNNQWQEVEVAIAPKHGYHDKNTMIKDLACDMSCLRKWLTEVEKQLMSLTLRPEWTRDNLQDKLKEHQVLQRDIESQSKVVSAVLKLSQRLYNDDSVRGDTDEDTDYDSSISPRTATALERRWHGVWLQSLEWQCRLEEALNNPKGVHGLDYSPQYSLTPLEESCSSENGSTQDVSCIVGDSEDDCLLIPREKLTDTPHRLDVAHRNFSHKLSFLDKSSGDSANISEAESKMEDSLASPDSLELPSVSASSDGEVDPARRIRCKQENKDIGYSSESHSNDEIELMRLQSLMEDKYPGKCEVASDSPFLSDVVIPRGRPKKEYYTMVSVDVDTTDKTTDNDDGTDTGNNNVGEKSGEMFVIDKSSSVWRETELRGERREAERLNCSAIPPQSQSTSEQSELENGVEPKDKIKYLIDKAEDLVRTSPKVIVTSTPKPVDRKTPEKQMRTVGCNTVNRKIISSCDASAEDTDNDSSSEEFSTATESEKQFDSVIGLDYTSDSRNASHENVTVPSLPPGLFDNVRLRKQQPGQRTFKNRPWSVVEMEEFTRNLQSQPFSTSESAIDRMSFSKTEEPSSPPPSFLSPRQASTFPRDNKYGHAMRRSFSTSDNLSSPRGAKRKLRYSSQNDTLVAPRAASQAATTPGSVLVPSSESEDEVTKHVSETDDMVDQFEMARVRSSGSSAESDSDNSDVYLTPLVEPVTSDNDDVLNSTGSFSENAWDNYQSPLYPAVSDDPTEEKLHWEPSDEMEFDDDFLLSIPTHKKNSAIAAAVADKKKAKNKITIPAPAQYEDSDSDIEDFHYVLDQSADQMRLADQSLKKKRKDPMGTGIYLKAAKYAEIMATCVTNSRCLESIGQHLDSADVAVGDYQRMQDILYQWEKLRALAAERQTQSTLLSGIYGSMNEMKRKHEEIESLMHTDKFSSARELEEALAKLKEQQRCLQSQKSEVTDLESQVNSFTEQYPAVPIGKFYTELADIQETNLELQNNLQKHVMKQEHTLAMWYEYLESCKEMEQLLAQDRGRLQKLMQHRDNGIIVSRKDLANEVETLQNSLSVYESKLSNLQSLRKELHGSSDEDTQTEFLASLADIRNQLLVYEQNCRQIQRNIDEEDEEMAIEAEHIGQLAVSAASLHEHIARRRRASGRESAESADAKTGLSSWLSSCPVQVAAAMMLAGIVYLFDPSIIQDMANFSIKISPELKYVNGPPPV